MASALQVDEGLEQARKRCADLLRRATGPMHVPQPDGTTLRLCYLGRIVRAQAMIDSAGPDLRPRVLARYQEIVAEAQAAWDDYVAARNAYANQCAWAGVEPDLPIERECQCAVCSEYQPPTVRVVEPGLTI